jgi:K+-transporting ATPase ATPase C chain
MIRHLWSCLALFVLLTIVTAGLYPLAVTVVAQTAFAKQANGSLIEKDGKKIGSELIGQTFSKDGYFWSRPSVTSPEYNGGASTGSNLGPINPALEDAVKSRVEKLKATPQAPAPMDMVSSSGSGLDPHITPAAAFFQIPRVAKARGWTETELRKLVDDHVEDRTFGLLGEKRINVLRLNLALDAKTPIK